MARTNDHHCDNSRGRTRRRTRKVYGAAKRLEMARSVLPSTLNAADELAAIRRRARRAVARDLRRYTGVAADAIEQFDRDQVDLARSPDDEIKEVVCDRRGADKLNPFLRWAAEVTRDLPVEERLDAIRRVMPANLIGRHAVLHASAIREFRWMDHEFRLADEADEAAERKRVVAAVRDLLADRRHRELNATMKASADWFWNPEKYASPAWRRHGETRWFRPLGGAWDAAAFVDDVLDNRYGCRGQAIALRRIAGELR